MKQIILVLLLAVVGWFVWVKYEERAHAGREAAFDRRVPPAKKKPVASAAQPANSGVSFYTCDNRSCNQMSSCEEARYFLANCGMNPGASGEGGTSCEKQWCKK